MVDKSNHLGVRLSVLSSKVKDYDQWQYEW